MIKVLSMNLFAYAGPVLASLALNGIWAVLGTICVYGYLNRERLGKKRWLRLATKPLHATIKKIATSKLNNSSTKK